MAVINERCKAQVPFFVGLSVFKKNERNAAGWRAVQPRDRLAESAARSPAEDTQRTELVVIALTDYLDRPSEGELKR